MEVKIAGAVRPPSNHGEYREAATMLTAEKLRVAGARPAQRVELREYAERCLRGECHHGAMA